MLIQDHEETSVASRELLRILGRDVLQGEWVRNNSGNLRESGTTWRIVEQILTFFIDSVFLSSVLLIKKYIRFVCRFHRCNS